MIEMAAADQALVRAQALTASGAALTERLRKERHLLLKAIGAELAILAGRARALALEARGGNAEAATRVICIHELCGELNNALLALGRA